MRLITPGKPSQEKDIVRVERCQSCGATLEVSPSDIAYRSPSTTTPSMAGYECAHCQTFQYEHDADLKYGVSCYGG